jgi:hypothetical protein
MAESAAEQSGMIDVDSPTQRKCSKWSLLPVKDILRRKLFRKEPISLESIAEKTWEIAPGETSITRPAYFLPNQLERVTGWVFSDGRDPKRWMEGGFEVKQTPTRGFLLKNAWLIDGVLYKDNASSYLHPRSSRWLPQLRVENEIERGAVYCTFPGNRYFGQWLMDDCLMYPLASVEGIPITTDQPASPHTLAYEGLLDMEPTRLHSAFLKEAVIFDDYGHNPDRRARFWAMREKLLSHKKPQSHPGVFILRGGTGERRIMHNEVELAEYLRDKRGFRIVDITKADVPTIVEACAGARVVAGVEGSHLIHGVQLLPPGGAVLTLQTPSRFCYSYKPKTDRDHQHFGFVVGFAEGSGFRVDPDEVERTLDLFPVLPDL